jgi:hypothetical protein
MGTGVLMPFREVTSLMGIIPVLQKRLIIFALVCFSIFTVMVTYKVISVVLIIVLPDESHEALSAGDLVASHSNYRLPICHIMLQM